MGVIDLSAYKPTVATLGDANQIRNGFSALEALLNGNIDNLNFGAGKIFDPLKLMQDGATAGQGLVWSAAANGGTGGWVPGSAGLVTLVADSKLGADTVSWDIQSIPGNPGDMLEFGAEVRASAAGSYLVVRCNNDAGAGNHRSGYSFTADVNTYSAVSSQITTYGYVGIMAVPAAVASHASGLAGRFINYAGTDWHKMYLANSEAELWDNANRWRAGTSSGTWLSTVAINRLTFFVDSGANIKQNGRLTIWRRAIA